MWHLLLSVVPSFGLTVLLTVSVIMAFPGLISFIVSIAITKLLHVPYKALWPCLTSSGPLSDIALPYQPSWIPFDSLNMPNSIMTYLEMFPFPLSCLAHLSGLILDDIYSRRLFQSVNYLPWLLLILAVFYICYIVFFSSPDADCLRARTVSFSFIFVSLKQCSLSQSWNPGVISEG